jgi:ferredoxin-NADP reductase
MTAIEAPPAPARRLVWLIASVRDITVESPRVKSITLDVRGWQGHRAGQHVDIRLTAADGFQAERSYSIASPPDGELLALTVERLENGEVSPYLVDELRIGDQFEVRGPIGGYFVWTGGGPLCLIAGGSGIAPLMAMLRHRERQQERTPASLVYSSRSADDIIYRNELDAMSKRDASLHILHTLTRRQPAGWTGHRGRVDRALLADACFPPAQNPKIFVCGPTPFVEDIARFLVELGHEACAIKTERFGPSGGSPS